MIIRENLTLNHINVRKEGPEDDKAVALDLKLSGTVSHEVIKMILTIDGEDSIDARNLFWLEDEVAAARILLISDIKLNRRYEGVDVSLSGLNLSGCSMKSFSFSPKDHGKAHLSFSVSCSTPPSNAVAILSEVLQEELKVYAESSQPDLFADDQEGAA
jgi:hypothetical protein